MSFRERERERKSIEFLNLITTRKSYHTVSIATAFLFRCVVYLIEKKLSIRLMHAHIIKIGSIFFFQLRFQVCRLTLYVRLHFFSRMSIRK